jgi:hypothetical protein
VRSDRRHKFDGVCGAAWCVRKHEACLHRDSEGLPCGMKEDYPVHDLRAACTCNTLHGDRYCGEHNPGAPDAIVPDLTICGTRKAPSGWYCTRTADHNGPRAARPWVDNPKVVILTDEEAWRLAKLLEVYVVRPELRSIIEKLKVAQ